MTFAETARRPPTRNHDAFLSSIEDRLAALDWARIRASLDTDGCALTGHVLSPQECEALAASYRDDERFRSRIVMTRHGFGRGEYKYFAHPLPDLVARLRATLYPCLAGMLPYVPT